jgi:hypothetical protein
MTESADKVKEIEDKYAAEREKPEVQDQTEEEQKALAKTERRGLAMARADGVVSMVKLFGGPVLLLVIGCGLIVKGHNILRARNAILAASLKSTEQLFRFYRQNVVAAEGAEADKRYMRGIVGEKEVMGIGLDDCGNEILKKEKVPVVRKGNPWQFEFSPTFFYSATGIPDRDLLHLQNVEFYFNRLYKGEKKYEDISMFEILDYLRPIWEAIDPDGSVRTMSRVYGWGHDRNGDDMIDLGVFRAANESAIKGVGDVVFMEFNCDGRLENLKNQYKARYSLV